MYYNHAKLMQELEDAGIPVIGCAGDGRIDFKDEATRAQIDQAEQIKLQHDPIPEPTPREKFKRLTTDKEKLDFIIKHLGLE